MANDLLLPSRRRLLRGAIAGVGAGLLAGCDALSRNKRFVGALELAEPLSMHAQRLLSGSRLAAEFPESMVSPVFRPNGSIDPRTPEYLALKADGFSSYRLRIRGLVRSPLEFDLDALRGLPQRTQVTRHDCVEGWSCIGKWKGVPIRHLLALARPAEAARFLVFRCADSLDGDAGRYYESVDLEEARHPQSILAYDMNDAPLTVPHGAPLRARLERKLGYKMAKYVVGLDLVASLAGIGGGQGGYWEDRGYQWHGSI